MEAAAAGMLESSAVRIADGFWRLGSKVVSWYLVEEGGRFTLVDAGLPGHRPQLDQALEELGHGLKSVVAVVLTHAHADHVGFAEDLRDRTGARVLVHEADAQAARTGRSPGGEGGFLPYLWRPAALGLVAHVARFGGVRPKPIREVTTYRHGETLDVPGTPRVIHAPGHTPGSSALHFPGHGVLAAGDVLCERNPLTGARGPQLLPRALTQDTSQALASLDRLTGVEAPFVVFGHGDPWTGGAAAAVAEARKTGPT